jgi:hypothetical protein
VNKLVQKFTKQGSVKSPMALCYLIRLSGKLIDDGDSRYARACKLIVLLQYDAVTARLSRIVHASQK